MEDVRILRLCSLYEIDKKEQRNETKNKKRI